MISLSKGEYRVCPERVMGSPPIENLLLHRMRNSLVASPNTFFELDGYTIDFQSKTCSAFLFKREYEVEFIDELLNHSLIEAFLETSETDGIRECMSLAVKLNIPIFVALWPLDYPAIKFESHFPPVWLFELRSRELVLNGYGVDLGNFLGKLRKRSFKAVKPLNAARTFMECKLSTTQNPWPGDLDCVVFNSETSEVEALLEFKTHNLNSPISLESKDRYMNADRRRFEVIEYLRHQISITQRKVPSILYLAWGPQHKHVKVQSIEHGKVYKEEIFNFPSSVEDTSLFFKAIKEKFL